MYPAFPSLTFPNHWTMVTGLHPESHGIVANDFYDPVLKQRFQHWNTSSSTNPHWWQVADPIWKTCSHFNRLTASVMWPGSEAVAPTYLYPFDSTKTPSEIMDLTLELIDMPYKVRPQFISVHVSQADSVGHGSGPDSDDIKSTVQMIDQAIGQLMDGIKQRHVEEHAHIIVVSDHGMARTDKYIYYDDILSSKSLSFLRHREGWPLLDLRPNDDAPADAIQQIYNEMATYLDHHPKDAHYKVYLKEDVPPHYHYRNNERIAPIVTIPDTGYAFLNHNTTDPSSGITQQPKGMHGYDILDPDMLAIFMAKGPKVDRWFPPTSTDAPRNRRLVPFHNVEVYEFLTELMNIDANPNNGTLNGKLVLKQDS
ncbi:alkaline-phosphatase-like protein [Absidia repens]|uniref:Alkaline-phosphatase-like protein n=1 Tax=Absidia repens TaxID=90262 RepID=A0A1X2I5D4_9FUNG|nr:alkaline-phosphatase-like protein [Absidia repens]